MSDETETAESAEREAALAREAEEMAKQAARAAAADVRIGYFDADGVCRLIQTGLATPPDDFAFAARVAPGLSPNDVRFNPETLRVNKSKVATVSIPEGVPVGEPFSIGLPAGVVAEVDGERHSGVLSIDTSEAGRKVLVELHGAQRGSFVAEVRGYAEERKAQGYPPIEEQLDMIVNLGVEAYRAEMMKVKARFPKPEGTAAK